MEWKRSPEAGYGTLRVIPNGVDTKSYEAYEISVLEGATVATTIVPVKGQPEESPLSAGGITSGDSKIRVNSPGILFF